MKNTLKVLFLLITLFALPLHSQDGGMRLGDLKAYTPSDFPDDATAKQFAELIAQKKVKEAEDLAKESVKKDEAIGHFLTGWLAETELEDKEKPDFIKAEAAYRKGMKAKDLASTVNLGALLLRANTKNPEAVELLKSVVEKDPKKAGFFLGIAYLSGAAGTPDFQSAAQVWAKSAEAGYVLANRHLGYLYQGMFGFPAQNDLKKAAASYQLGAEAGDEESSIRLGILILQAGDKIDRKPKEAAAWLEKASATNNPGALYLLGQVREQEMEGIKADPKLSREYYKKAADQGHAGSMLRLGNLIERGVGGASDMKEAIALYRKSAEQGEPGAYFNLGILSQKGEGMDKSDTEAFRYYLQAGQRGFNPAANYIGNSYRAGVGTNTDMIAAAAWYTRGAEAGDSNAMVSLAEMMILNQGVPQNAELFNQLTQRSLSMGNPRSAFLLGRMSERGLGTKQDIPQALAYFRWAAKRDYQEAKTAALELEKNLTKEQLKAVDEITKKLEDQLAEAAKAPTEAAKSETPENKEPAPAAEGEKKP